MAWLGTLALLGTVSGAFVPPGVGAQETIASDRPGIGSGATVLPAGVFQVETGIEHAAAGGADAWSFGQALLRVGFGAVEAEAFGNSYAVLRDGGETVADGFQDVGFGLKAPLLRREGAPSVSLQGIVTAPTGASAFSGDEWSTTLNALADFTLSETSALSVNAGWARGLESEANALALIVTPAVALGEGWGAYGGWAGFFHDGEDQHFLEAGLTWLRSADAQLDANAGWDVPSGDWFFGVGVAVRRVGG